MLRKLLLLVTAVGFLPLKSFAEPKSDILAPALSLLLPGLDQWWEDDYSAAMIYSGLYLGGASIASGAATSLADRQEADPDFNPDEDLDSRDNDVRRLLLGTQIAFAAGSFSTLHAFANAVETRKAAGQYSFLGEKVTVADTALAPFRFGYLTRPSTFIPLGVLGTLSALAIRTDSPEFEKVALTGTDYGFAGGFSYLAGTHEEALFRGWMMPVFREYVGGDTIANSLQSILFAAAHMGSVDVPIAQLLLGYHLGYVTEANGWSLGEAAFIHTWWDVIAFLTSFSVREKPKAAETAAFQASINGTRPLMAKKAPLPVLRLPPLVIRF